MSLNLKLLRVQANMTLEEVAQATDMTRGYLSKIERGLAQPSVGAALKLAKVLGVPVEDLFGEQPGHEAVTITRASTARANSEFQGFARMVAGTRPGHRMVAFVLKPGNTRTRRHPMSRHEGEELLFVLSGRVNLQLASRGELLERGDCAHFNSAVPHKITASGGEEAEVLIVISTDEPKPNSGL